jgi:hypothetical protein
MLKALAHCNPPHVITRKWRKAKKHLAWTLACNGSTCSFHALMIVQSAGALHLYLASCTCRLQAAAPLSGAAAAALSSMMFKLPQGPETGREGSYVAYFYTHLSVLQ